jgi:2-oxoglutarate ferredoxin oxidoreductase subunit gamma
MREEIIIAGAGGQGAILMGKLLTRAGLIEGREVSWIPSYGAEARGGTAHSMVIISDEEIASPIIINPTICFAMNEPSFKRFASRVNRGGLLIVNSSLIKKRPLCKGIDALWFPLTEIANRLGNTKVANMVALGVYLANPIRNINLNRKNKISNGAKKKIVSLKSIIEALKIILSDSKLELLALNIAAIKEGMRLVVLSQDEPC